MTGLKTSYACAKRLLRSMGYSRSLRPGREEEVETSDHLQDQNKAYLRQTREVIG